MSFRLTFMNPSWLSHAPFSAYFLKYFEISEVFTNYVNLKCMQYEEKVLRSSDCGKASKVKLFNFSYFK